MGLLLSQGALAAASGAGLLFCTNLLGILTGGLVLMACKDPYFREQLTRSHLSAASFVLTGLCGALGSGFISLLRAKHQESTREMVGQTIQRFLENETITFGDVDGVPESEAVDLESVRIDWTQTPPEIRALVRVVTRASPPTRRCVKCRSKSTNARGTFQLVVERLRWSCGPMPPLPQDTTAKTSLLRTAKQKQAPIARRGREQANKEPIKQTDITPAGHKQQPRSARTHLRRRNAAEESGAAAKRETVLEE